MYCRLILIPALALLLAACSPALNWREVPLANGELKALLPCKPDRASRKQNLATHDLDIAMAGCEAGGALYAVSVAELPAPDRALAVQVQWQANLLENMRASGASNAAYAIKGASSTFEPVRLIAAGTGPDGRVVQAQGVWFARGTRLYHAVIYAERIGADMSEPFFGGLELQ